MRQRLHGLVGAPAALFVGSGTVANEAIAATLAADPLADNGLILVNGEFGERLRKQVERWGLRPRACVSDWGQPWRLDEAAQVMRTMRPGGWVWGVHHETSTGMRNDLDGLLRLAESHGLRVCLDAVSSIGALPIPGERLWLVSGSSGKALGAYPGLAFVFGTPESLRQVDTMHVPTYLDIGAALSAKQTRFTLPSPFLAALDAALERYATPEQTAQRFAEYEALGRFVRAGLRSAGLTPFVADADAAPVITTFAPPAGCSAEAFRQRCEAWNYQIAGQSNYLVERNLVQIAVMGELRTNDLEPLLARIAAEPIGEWTS